MKAVKTIYFAGPDIFMPDYEGHMARIKDLCAASGLTPLLPGELELCAGESAPIADDIFRLNLSLIKKADIIIANLVPFRGPVEPDSGTVFECGYGYASGKAVIGVVPDQRDLATRLGADDAPQNHGGRFLLDGSWVEDYGQPVNLMLACCFTAMAATVEEAIAVAARLE
ncbi:hypothetical protein C4J81_13420 [Deltaproteobacteria bacterium Smac51]|nr:hypothetical protein C4J81_13420 [Deltaproteobacteria bacterium Smac51]